jgi:amino acid transporter
MASVGTVEDVGLEALGYRQELNRSLSLLDLLVYGLVFIVPIAPLLNFGFVFNASQGMVPLVYAVGLVAMTFTAISYVTMSQTFPVAGSVYAYAGLGVGLSAGFMAGWAMLLDYLLLPSLVYVQCSAALSAVVPGVPKPVWVLVMLAGITAINLLGIQTTAKVNKALLALQLVFLATFAVLGIIALKHGVAGAHLSLGPLWDPAKVSPGLIFGALSLAAVSFLGFDAISTLSEEALGGRRAVGRATILSLVVVAGLFIGQTYLACLFLLHHGPFAAGDASANAHLYVAQLIGGPSFKFIAAGLVVIICGIPCALVSQAATARLIFSMARDDRLPRALAHIDPRFQTPQRAVLLVSAATLVISLTLVDRLDLLFSLVSFGALCGFLMVHLSVLTHHAWRGGSRRWITHVAVPILGLAIIGYILLNLDPLAKMVGGLWLAVGGAGLTFLKLRGASARP